jgi:hypothetical protein
MRQATRSVTNDLELSQAAALPWSGCPCGHAGGVSILNPDSVTLTKERSRVMLKSVAVALEDDGATSIHPNIPRFSEILWKAVD